MKKLLFSLVALTVFVATGYGTVVTMPHNNDAVAVKTGTVAASQVDTVKFTASGNLQALSFNAYYVDSVSITSCKVYRVANGVIMTLFAGDTLTAFSSFAKNGSGNPTSYVGSAVVVSDPPNSRAPGATLSRPCPDQFWFVVTYSTAVGTSTTVTYKVIKTLTK